MCTRTARARVCTLICVCSSRLRFCPLCGLCAVSSAASCLRAELGTPLLCFLEPLAAGREVGTSEARGWLALGPCVGDAVLFKSPTLRRFEYLLWVLWTGRGRPAGASGRGGPWEAGARERGACGCPGGALEEGRARPSGLGAENRPMPGAPGGVLAGCGGGSGATECTHLSVSAHQWEAWVFGGHRVCRGDWLERDRCSRLDRNPSPAPKPREGDLPSSVLAPGTASCRKLS